MKKKLFKRLLGLVLITIISISIANPIGALAAGTSEAESKDISVSTKENQLVRGWVSPNSSIDLYPKLDNYVGLTKRFYVSTVSESTSGAIFLYLYDKNGKLISKDWIVGDNVATYFDTWLPVAGTFRLHIVAQGTNANVLVSARWQ